MSRARRLPQWIQRLPIVGSGLRALAEATPSIVHDGSLIARCTGLQISIVLLDAGTRACSVPSVSRFTRLWRPAFSSPVERREREGSARPAPGDQEHWVVAILLPRHGRCRDVETDKPCRGEERPELAPLEAEVIDIPRVLVE